MLCFSKELLTAILVLACPANAGKAAKENVAAMAIQSKLGAQKDVFTGALVFEVRKVVDFNIVSNSRFWLNISFNE